MSEQRPDPNTVQVTAWRNVLDAFAQLSAAWQAASEAQRASGDEPGPGNSNMPEPLMLSFARAGEETATVLTAIASVLAQQPTAPPEFGEIAEAQRTARARWRAGHARLEDSA